MSAPALYEALADLAVRERELAEAGRLDELEALRPQRAALVAALPGDPPASALPALERAADAQAGVTAALRAALAATGRELAGLDRARTANRAYAHGAGVEDAAPLLKFSA